MMDPRDDLEARIQRFLLTVLKPSLVKTRRSRLGQGSLGWGSAGVAVAPCEICREFGRWTGGGQRRDLIDGTKQIDFATTSIGAFHRSQNH